MASDQMENHNGLGVVIELRPFQSSMFDHSVDSAWPHQKGDKPNGPLIVSFTWGGKKNDDFWIGYMKSALARIREKARGQNCIVDNAPV
jgi:hypothetical protein